MPFWVGYLLFFGSLIMIIFLWKKFIDYSFAEGANFCDVCGTEMKGSYDQNIAAPLRAVNSELNQRFGGRFDTAVQKCDACKRVGK